MINQQAKTEMVVVLNGKIVAHPNTLERAKAYQNAHPGSTIEHWTQSQINNDFNSRFANFAD